MKGIFLMLIIAFLLLGCLGERGGQATGGPTGNETVRTPDGTGTGKGTGDGTGNETALPVPDEAKVRLPDGKIIGCELALTQQEIQLGLMGRNGLCGSCGMLFIFNNEGRHGFWMKNMKFNIDIIFIGKDWKVVGIAQDAPPCKSEPCTVYYPDSDALYVLELNANSTSEHGIKIGSEIARIE